MTKKTPSPQMAFVDDPKAPEVYCSAVAGYFANSGNVTIAFESLRINHEAQPGPATRVVNLRLILPGAAAISLVQNLTSFLQSNGVDPFAKPPNSQHIQ